MCPGETTGGRRGLSTGPLVNETKGFTVPDCVTLGPGGGGGGPGGGGGGPEGGGGGGG